MARRLFNGRAFSEDGWPYVDPGSCTWVTVPGSNGVTLQIQNGAPIAILRAFAADFNAHVEPLRDRDSACFTWDNSVSTSNHPGATSMDLNWDGPDGKTFRYGISKERAYPGDKSRKLDELIAFYEGMIFCGGEWSIRDWMHFQLGPNTYDQKNDRPFPKVNDFIARKIRADGFSTFNRGNSPVAQPLSKSDQYAVLIIAEGRRRGVTPRGIQIALATALVESNIKIYANQRVPESMVLYHDAVGSDAYSVGIFQQQIRDTGNGWWWSDAKTCMDPTTSAGLFYDRLDNLNYNGPNSPGSYAQAVQSSAYPDRYDQRFQEAVDLYNRLANAESTDDMANVPQDQWDWVYNELHKLFRSRSMYRADDSGDTFAGRVLDAQAFGWDDRVESSARRGELWAIDLVAKCANGTAIGVKKDDGSVDSFLVNHARAVLQEISTINPTAVQAYVNYKKAA